MPHPEDPAEGEAASRRRASEGETSGFPSEVTVRPRTLGLEPRAAAQGMTLVELLLAVTLFSTLMASSAGLLHNALRSALGWGATLKPYQQMERAFGRLEQDLESAQPLFAVPVMGSGQRFELARIDAVSNRDGQRIPTWVRVVYELRRDGAGVSLVREAFSDLASSDEAVLLDHERLVYFASASFEFGVLTPDKRLMWEPSWDGTVRGVPRLLRLTCELAVASDRPPLGLARTFRNPAGSLPTTDTP